LTEYTGRTGWNAERSHFAQLWMTKSRAYEFDHEVRAVTVIRPLDEHGASDYDKSDHPVGINVAVDLATLLEVVDISPKRPAYFRKVVVSVMRHYDCPNVPLVHSPLGITPSWWDSKRLG
jgi:hypothetical protein